MTSDTELQSEELDVLNAIFDGDELFKVLKNTDFQYKFGDDTIQKTFILEIHWPENYPSTSSPSFTLDSFYNRNLLDVVKIRIKSELDEYATSLVGDAATYSLIDFVKENYLDWMSEQPDCIVQQTTGSEVEKESIDLTQNVTKEIKSSQMSKSQKRKLWDRGGDDKDRGCDWVDIVKHLSQTGGGPDQLQNVTVK